jgi:hypothetical protein
MRTRQIAAALVVFGITNAGAAWAQLATDRVEVRFVPGVSHDTGIFGDDSPKAHGETALTLGAQVWMPRSSWRAFVFEGSFSLNALENPHFDEQLTALFLQMGFELGRTVYVRPSAGVALQSWSGAFASDSFGVAPAVGLTIGHRRHVRGGFHISPELVTRVSVGFGIFTWSVGVQVPFGRQPH